jgi:hypothetical protein
LGPPELFLFLTFLSVTKRSFDHFIEVSAFVSGFCSFLTFSAVGVWSSYRGFVSEIDSILIQVNAQRFLCDRGSACILRFRDLNGFFG